MTLSIKPVLFRDVRAGWLEAQFPIDLESRPALRRADSLARTLQSQSAWMGHRYQEPIQRRGSGKLEKGQGAIRRRQSNGQVPLPGPARGTHRWLPLRRREWPARKSLRHRLDQYRASHRRRLPTNGEDGAPRRRRRLLPVANAKQRLSRIQPVHSLYFIAGRPYAFGWSDGAVFSGHPLPGRTETGKRIGPGFGDRRRGRRQFRSSALQDSEDLSIFPGIPA